MRHVTRTGYRDRPISRLLAGTAAVLVCLAAAPQARGAYLAAAGAAQAPCSFKASHPWSFPAAGADNSAPLGGPNWTYDFASPAPAAGPTTIRDLTVNITHPDPAPVCDIAHGAGPAIALALPNVQRAPIGPAGRAVARRVEHGTHADYVVAAVTTPAAGNLTIKVTGIHGDGPPGGWSFTNIGTSNYSSVKITPSYRNADGSIQEGEEINGGGVLTGFTINGRLPRDAAGNLPTNYTVRAFGSPMTLTTLAFLGLVDGIAGVTELELGTLIDLFGGTFLAPVLRAADQVEDLFVFIDLTTYLGLETTFDPLESFVFVDGTTEELPGLSVFTTQFTLNPDGTLSGDRFSGVLIADAMIDGTTIPVPAPALLFATALIGLTAVRAGGKRLLA